MMKLSISNIGWEEKNDEAVYEMMIDSGFEGVEIAPTRVIVDRPYDRIYEAKKWADNIKRKYGLVIPSMQSIWYGRKEQIFGSQEELLFLIDYSKKAIDFAKAIGCKNLVFGCPRNRNKPSDAEENRAIVFLKEIGDYAYSQSTIIGMEANPSIYNTNYINDTKSALDLIEIVNSQGFKLNLDIGTMIANEEDISIISGKENLINHVHICEPFLEPIKERKIHSEIREILVACGYEGFVSIEVKKQDDINALKKMITYIGEVFK